MARMFHPSHPGETLRDDVLPALGMKVTQAAEQVGCEPRCADARAAWACGHFGGTGQAPRGLAAARGWLGAQCGVLAARTGQT